MGQHLVRTGRGVYLERQLDPSAKGLVPAGESVCDDHADASLSSRREFVAEGSLRVVSRMLWLPEKLYALI